MKQPAKALFYVCQQMISFSLLYLLFLLFIYLFQSKLIYFPATQSLEQLKRQAAYDRLELWPNATNYRGLLSSGEAEKGTVLVFHGNAGSAIYRNHYVMALEKQGYRVIVAEYPGYGAREGNPSETVLVSDAKETAGLALEKFGKPLYLWGESLGAGVATTVAKNNPDITGIALVTPFDSLPNVAQHHYWFLLGKWLSRERYDNVANLQDYQGNVAVIIAEKDEIIPNALTMRLYDGIKSPKKLWRFQDSGHNSLPMGADMAWWKEVMDFISRDDS